MEGTWHPGECQEDGTGATVGDRTPIAPGKLPRLPREVGYGSFGRSHLSIYNGFLKSKELLGRDARELDDILFFGDDFSGTLFCFDCKRPGLVFAVDSSSMELTEESRGFEAFIVDYLNRIAG